MTISKKLFSGILCASLLMASAPAKCSKKLGLALIIGGCVGFNTSMYIFKKTFRKCDDIEADISMDIDFQMRKYAGANEDHPESLHQAKVLISGSVIGSVMLLGSFASTGIGIVAEGLGS